MNQELDYIVSLLNALGYNESESRFLVRFYDISRLHPFVLFNILAQGKDIFRSWFNTNVNEGQALVITIFDDNFINITRGDKEGNILDNLTYDIAGQKRVDTVPAPIKMERYDLSLFRLVLGSAKDE